MTGLKYTWKLDIDAFRGSIRNIRPSSERPVLEYRHYFASHQPPMYRRDCIPKRERDLARDVSSVEDELYCVLSSVGLFLDKLRELRLYDRTMIVITSDHGYEIDINNLQFPPLAQDFFFPLSATTGPDNIKPAGSYNPTLIFKDFGSRGALKVNQAPASLLDITVTVCEDLGGCNSLDLEGVSLRDVPPNRERRYWRYGGGRKERYSDGTDRLHKGLDEWWDVRSFRGTLANGLVPSIFPASPRSGVTMERTVIDGGINFRSGGNSILVKGQGWGGAEKWGSWTVGKTATLLIPARTLEQVARLTLNTRAFLPNPDGKLNVSILVDGKMVGTTNYSSDSRSKKISFELPDGISGQDNGIIVIEIQIDRPQSPRELGMSEDGRKLGIGVNWLKFS